MATNGRTPVNYVYDIPYNTRHRLCMVLDAGGEWRTLAGELQYSADYVRWLALALQRPGGSPTDDLLRDWGQSNATVTSLFRHLRTMHHYRALSILRDLVPEEMCRDIDLGSGVGEERELRQPRVNPQMEQKHTHELPAPEFPHFPIQDQQNIPNNTAQNIPNNTAQNIPNKAGEHGEGASVMTYSDNDAYSSSLESQAIAEQQKQQNCLKAAVNKQPVESPDISFNSDLKTLSQSAALMNTQHFSYNEIRQATYGFHDDYLLGKGGFGTVYKGIMKNTTFAIKVLKNKPGTNVAEQQKQHMVEIKALLRYRHDNIIQLCGYSMDGAHLCLVYQFMENGSLENRLMCKDDTKPLGWALRHHILTGSARGIQYLHSLDDKPLIHGDIKSANILLDHHFDPKVADFGLAKEATSQNQSGKYTHVSKKKGEKMFGSPAYLPAEFYSSYQFSIKTDTYSFGVVIYETCTGELAMEEKREGGKKLKDYIDTLWSDNQDEFQHRLRDKKAADWLPQCWDRLMRLGHDCTSLKKKDRPTMQTVLSRLEEIEKEAKRALADVPPITEDFTHYSYASEGQGQNNLAANLVENSKPSQSVLETITNGEPNSSDPDMLSYDHRKLELDSASDVSGSVVDSKDCNIVSKIQKLALDAEPSACTVTPSDRGLHQSSNHAPDRNPREPSKVPQELDEGPAGATEMALVGDTGRCVTVGEDSMRIQGLMKDLTEYGVDMSSSVENTEWESDSAEICRKSLKKRPQFVRAIFAIGDQCNGADPDSQLTQNEDKQQQHTESTDLYGPPQKPAQGGGM